MEDCVFCKIINGELPSSKVYEDDEILAFDNIEPLAPRHILVIPKKHIESHSMLEEKDEALIGRIHSVINKIAEEKGFKNNGFRVVVNCGEDGGQTVKHLHFHILAGTKLDERTM